MATRSRSAPRVCARRAGARGARASASMERSPRRSTTITIDRLAPVGDYAINIAFSDGHARGIYPWAYLQKIVSADGRAATTTIASSAAARRAVSRRTMRMTSDAKTEVIETDLLVLGGGTGGPMAAIKAKEKNPACGSLLLEKANVKRSGAISHGHGRAEQRRHPRPRHARAIREGDHRRQRRHRQPEGGPRLRPGQLRDDPGARPAGA